MNDNLFDIPETLSPRLAWMREHGIEVTENTLTGTGHLAFMPQNGCAFGDTEDEALIALAIALKIKLWNQ